MLIVGEARYTNGLLVLPSQLEWEEGAKVIVAKINGAYVLIPISNDVDTNFLLLVEQSIREHRESLEALAK
jgi:predicted DNA-binding antitoxin AbrB/MazE fold protein